jgi:hypothetical protein
MLQVDYLVVAEAALAANNRHYIHGTIDVLWATAVPVIHPALSIAVRLRVPWNDANTPFPLEIDLVDPDEESILPERPQGTITMGRPPTAIPGEDGLVPLVYNLAMIQFRKPGTHAVVLRMGDYELQRARFQVRLVANRQPAPPPPPPAPPHWDQTPPLPSADPSGRPVPPAGPPQNPTPPVAPPTPPVAPPSEAPQNPGTHSNGLAEPPHLPFSLGGGPAPSSEPDAPDAPDAPPAGD